MTFDTILRAVAEFSTAHVTVTGGEPLAQRPCRSLLELLCNAGHTVSLETSGAIDISDIDSRVRVVMDLKTPGSGECDKNRYENIAHLKKTDEVKFVIRDRADFTWSRDMVDTHKLATRCDVLFSPVYNALPPRMLAEWVLADRLPVRVQIQLHKILWGEERGR